MNKKTFPYASVSIILLILVGFMVGYFFVGLFQATDDLYNKFPEHGSGFITDKFEVGKYVHYIFVIDNSTHCTVDTETYYSYTIGDFYKW